MRARIAIVLLAGCSSNEGTYVRIDETGLAFAAHIDGCSCGMFTEDHDCSFTSDSGPKTCDCDQGEPVEVSATRDGIAIPLEGDLLGATLVVGTIEVQVPTSFPPPTPNYHLEQFIPSWDASTTPIIVTKGLPGPSFATTICREPRGSTGLSYEFANPSGWRGGSTALSIEELATADVHVMLVTKTQLGSDFEASSKPSR